jgi:TRAP-type C4-dicarboxylate transport system substrate-binding protein
MITRRDALRLGAGISALALTGGLASRQSAFAADKMVFKASDVHPAGYPTVTAVENMGKKLNRPPMAGSACRCSPP